MDNNQQFIFLQNKIQEIGSAIFFNLSDAVLKLPTAIVSSIKVDDFGYVWFSLKKPKQNLKEFDSEFPVRLDFYRKGMNYYLQVEGKAWVVTDPEEMNTLNEHSTQPLYNLTDSVLVKVKITKAEYSETKTTHRNSWWQNAMSTMTTWFRNTNNFRPGNTYFPAS